jgi:menaquinone-specific isochorismate synthase
MSTQNNINLSELDFSAFLNCGEIIQMPNSNEVWLGCGQLESKGEINSTKFYQCNFKGDDFREFAPKFLVKTTTEDLSSYLSEKFSSFTQIFALQNRDNLFVADVRKMVEWIKSEEPIEKLVAVTTCEYGFKVKEHPLSQFKRLLELNGAIYGKWINGKGTLGVSPEPLFIKTKENWITKALAGTVSTDIPNFSHVLLNDDKELLEHDLVIRDIVFKLDKFATQIKVEATTCVEFGAIAHIQTLISFDSDTHGPHSLIHALSPTAALGGYPAKNVYSFLSRVNYYQKEKDERLFGGIFGIISPDECFGLVSIRNIYWTEDGLTIHSGCGVVKNSTPEKELDEVQNKRSIIERLFI